ncbi:hypothetical protein ENC19_14320 [Verrucosispora sp. CWR15]|uniref:Uncharacterized protein n=1 Tax=Verrucosispora sioxanthis TaxID=2499994 RepID=A0A6M1KUR3_9ACTN|nr:hypothetical protein [Verrucosispora sioxanthis]NEE64648.1 hypothetical protein [Verrucosispora sioxanthis]NGM13758.1 hypothetical protein [Verrucosispora sioxanthis]
MAVHGRVAVGGLGGGAAAPPPCTVERAVAARASAARSASGWGVTRSASGPALRSAEARPVTTVLPVGVRRCSVLPSVPPVTSGRASVRVSVATVPLRPRSSSVGAADSSRRNSEGNFMIFTS